MSSVVSCLHLSQYRVELADLECTEYQFRVPVDFTQKVKDNLATPIIIKLLTALSNSSGGVVSLCCQSPCDDSTIKHWIKVFKDKLKSIYTQDEFLHNIKIHTKNTFAHILIKKSAQIIYDYGLYQRSDEENIMVTNHESAAKLMQAKSGTFVEKTCPSYTWNSPSGISEDNSTELKCWKTSNVSEIVKRLNDERNDSSLFAFLNSPEGGTILIGVEEDEKTKQTTIKGQKLCKTEESVLIKTIYNLMSADSASQRRRIWGTTNQAPALGTYWDVKIDEVENCPKNEPRRVVIRILLKHYPGGVFKHSPQHYKINYDGTVCRFALEYWRDLIFQSSVQHQTTMEANFNAKKREAQTAVESPINKSKTTVTSRPTDTGSASSSTIDEIDSPPIRKVLSQKDKLSFTDNTNDWREYLRIGENKLSDFIQTTSNLMGNDKSLYFWPGKQVIMSFGKNTDIIQQCISEIEMTHDNARGMAIASKEWLGLIQDKETCSSFPSPPQGHVMDIIVVDEYSNINIWVLFDQDPTNTSLNKYIRDVGRQLKYKLMADSKVVQSVCVQSRLFTSRGIRPSSVLDVECAEFFTSDSENTNVIRESFYKLLLSKQTSIQTTLGDQCLIKLTMHQASQVIGSDIVRFSRCHGGPGTGKTILLLYLSKHVFPKDECVILCPNPNLKAYYDFQKAAHCEVINTDEDMITFLETDLFDSRRCLLIDDCQVLTLKQETWFTLFDKIKKQEHKYLFVFYDNKIQNYGDSEENVICIKNIISQYEQLNDIEFDVKHLTKIHRNSQKVASFISKSAYVQTKSWLICSHDAVGDDVEVVKVERLRDRGPNNGLVKLIDSLTDSQKLLSGQMTAYEARHIAVLIDGNNTESDVELFKQILDEEGFQTQGADRFPVTGLIVTSVRSFSGLDAQVVLLVAPERFSPNDQPNIKLGLYEDKYKAFVASRGVYRVMFITEDDLNPDVMRALNMNKLP